MTMQAEMAPMEDNRVTLSDDIDAIGQPKDNFDVFDGIDATGEAIATYRIDTASDYAALTACIELCDKEEDCRNITLAKNDHPVIGKKNMCWLTDDNVQRNSSPYYYTATKKP